MKNHDKVYLKHWLPYHFYTDMHITDAAYLQVCNDVYQAWQKEYAFRSVSDFLNKDEIKEMAAFLTSYLEDLASETGIFQTFSSLHQSFYGQPVPFANNEILYDEPEQYREDYYAGEPNSADLVFLIWYFINCNSPNRYIGVNNHFIADLALIAYEEFYAAWETVPENTKLQEHFRCTEDLNDYYAARNYASKIFQSAYLLAPDIQQRVEADVARYVSGTRNTPEMLDEVLDGFIHSERSHLLALSFTDWAAAYLGEEHPAYSIYKTISPRISGIYLVQAINEKTVSMLHKASGHVFEVLKKSLDLERQEIEISSTHFLSIVSWNGDWWFSGISFPMEEDAKISPEEYRQINSLHVIDRVIGDPVEQKEELTLYKKAFHQLSKGKDFVFMDEANLGGFFSQFAQTVNSLKGHDGDTQITATPSSSKMTKVVVFFNEKSGLEVARVAKGIPDSDNPWFDANVVEEVWNIILMSDSISTEFAKTCVAEYGEASRFFEQEPKSYYFNDLDFLLRYWKCNHYPSYPINMTTQANN